MRFQSTSNQKANEKNCSTPFCQNSNDEKVYSNKDTRIFLIARGLNNYASLLVASQSRIAVDFQLGSYRSRMLPTIGSRNIPHGRMGSVPSLNSFSIRLGGHRLPTTVSYHCLLSEPTHSGLLCTSSLLYWYLEFPWPSSLCSRINVHVFNPDKGIAVNAAEFVFYNLPQEVRQHPEKVLQSLVHFSHQSEVTELCRKSEHILIDSFFGLLKTIVTWDHFLKLFSECEPEYVHKASLMFMSYVEQMTTSACPPGRSLALDMIVFLVNLLMTTDHCHLIKRSFSAMGHLRRTVVWSSAEERQVAGHCTLIEKQILADFVEYINAPVSTITCDEIEARMINSINFSILTNDDLVWTICSEKLRSIDFNGCNCQLVFNILVEMVILFGNHKAAIKNDPGFVFFFNRLLPEVEPSIVHFAYETMECAADLEKCNGRAFPLHHRDHTECAPPSTNERPTVPTGSGQPYAISVFIFR
ncbi:unnamed protein product [Nesidiocoris tenuis]|uniref:Uncharacterized protein n=1 Tax=Nesidiocoris tenuis TaxID=355587 RepID=A0A6H5HNT1_9HEMI|nr:unnamed protein product [Nesidiocoris tenuis]